MGDYKAALADWQDRLRQRIRHHLGRYLMVRTDQNLNRLLLQDWDLPHDHCIGGKEEELFTTETQRHREEKCIA